MIIVPIVSFYLASDNGPDAPTWQNGQPSAYANIMLGNTGSAIFYPFLAYSMLCMLLLLVSPRRFARVFIVRLGIYTGVVLALQYTILLGMAVDDNLFHGAIATGVLLPLGINWVYPKITTGLGTRRTWAAIIGVVAFFLLIALFAGGNLYLSIIPTVAFIAILGSGPLWCLILSVLVSLRLLRDYGLAQKHHIGHFLGISAWLIAYIEAWPVAISRTLELYATLPTSAPDCYIATAAARGHPRIVKSELLVTGSGRTVWLNAQVRTLKAAELALVTVFPGGHRVVRALYDRFGPPLACMIMHPLLADMAYMSLKPIEWGARAAMRLFAPHLEDAVHRLYA
jgi:hypothetical protein